MNFYTVLLVGFGGFLGSIGRYILSTQVDNRLNSAFPYGTLLVNLIGCFLLGLIYGWISQKSADNQHYKIFLITGFCGGFTTFSAFAFENLLLFQNRDWAISAVYVSGSVALGIAAVFFGHWLITR